jgi:hypothetical protein
MTATSVFTYFFFFSGTHRRRHSHHLFFLKLLMDCVEPHTHTRARNKIELNLGTNNNQDKSAKQIQQQGRKANVTAGRQRRMTAIAATKEIGAMRTKKMTVARRGSC